mgnify:CR=1 FL=1
MKITEKLERLFIKRYCEVKEAPTLIVMNPNVFSEFEKEVKDLFTMDQFKEFKFRGVRVVRSTDLEDNEIIVK